MSVSEWFVYILNTQQNRLYTGITTDIDRRFEEHSGGKKGAKFTRANKPVAVVYREQCADRSTATKRECEIKKLSRTQKLELING